MSILILNGHVVDPINNRNGLYDLLISKNKIMKIEKNLRSQTAEKVIDAKGLLVLPGFIDLHVHLRQPGFEYKETIKSGTRAAARGGFTSVVCMPNTDPVNDSIEITKKIFKIIEKDALVRVLVFAAVTKGLSGNTLVDFKKLIKSGVAGFTNDGSVISESGVLIKALNSVKNSKALIMEHPEDPTLSKNGMVNKGLLSKKYNLGDIPNISEDIIVARDLLIQNQINSRLHLTHISTSGAMEMIKTAKKRGISVSADVTPHHMLLNDDMFETLEAIAKVKPPIRSEKDRQAMITGILDGTFDCIATDHAPHSEEEKSRDFTDVPFGLTGLETAFPLVFDRFVRRNVFDIQKLVNLFSVNPSKILDLNDRGSFSSGKLADITIADPEKSFEISKDDFWSKSKNSPFIGWQGKGCVTYTIVDGEIVYQDT